MTTPPRKAKVCFVGPKPRPPRDDELSVMEYFANHIAVCRICLTTKDHTRNIYLCSRGYGYAMDVRQYLYLRDGKVLSGADYRRNKGEVEVEVPRQYDAIFCILSRRPISGSASQSAPRIHRYRLPHSMPSRSKISGFNSDCAKSPTSRQTSAKAEGTYSIIYVTIPSITVPLRIRRSDEMDVYGKNT